MASVVRSTALFILLVAVGRVEADIIISEFAAAPTGVVDDDKEPTDWIELHNPGNTPISLLGWSLTDDPNHDERWTIPDIRLEGGAYLIVYASGKDRETTDQSLHTDFKLDRAGGYLALIRPGETRPVSVYQAYPAQRRGFSYGRDDAGAPFYYSKSTPGAVNALPAFTGLVESPVYSVSRGLYDETMTLELVSPTPDAGIRFTTDGTPPSATKGMLFEGPIDLSTTTIVRAIAFREGWASSNVETHTYVFPRQVLLQDGRGLPRHGAWGRRGPDWGMDPAVVAHGDPESKVTADDLRTLPTVSLALPFEDMWGSGGGRLLWRKRPGIYLNGEAEPRAVSMEYIDPETGAHSQINAAVQITGGTSTIRWSRTNKLSLRLKFMSAYGEPKWRFRPFSGDDDAPGRFDTLILDARSNYAWSYHGFMNPVEQQVGAQYVRDQFLADLQREVGGHAPRGRPVHLYICGLYWGVYVMHERPDEHFAAHYFGGESEDYTVVKHEPGLVTNGEAARYTELIQAAEQDLSLPENYARMTELLEMEEFINYMLTNFYGGNIDWAHHNWYATHNDVDPAGRWRFHSWDAEKVLLNLEDDLTGKVDAGGPTAIHHQLKGNVRYRFAFADLAHRHLTGEGALTPAAVTRLYEKHVKRIDRAVAAESARWGDSARRPAYTRGKDWIRERDRILKNYLPERTTVVLQQLLRAGLYPETPAPVFSQPAGLVEEGTSVALKAGTAETAIYFTTDGTDPCVLGTGQEGQRQRLITSRTERRAYVPRDGALERAEPDWKQLAFDDSNWRRGLGGAGYEARSGFERFLGPNFDFREELYGKRTSLYLRIPFTVDQPDDIKRLLLLARRDDGFVAYLNGEEVTRSNMRTPRPAWNHTAVGDGNDRSAVVFQEFSFRVRTGLLRKGANVLAVHAFNDEASSSDMLIDVQLVVGASSRFPGVPAESARRYAEPVVLEKTTVIKARGFDGSEWSPLVEAAYHAGIEPAGASNLAITAIHYHPATLSEAEKAAGFTKRSQFEFLEVTNTGARTIDLSGVRFSSGIEFAFADGESAMKTMTPGQTVALVADEAAYRHRFGGNLTIAGTFQNDTQLSNGGERLALRDQQEQNIVSLRYGDDSPWPTEADGAGSALSLVDPGADPSDPASWRPRDVRRQR